MFKKKQAEFTFAVAVRRIKVNIKKKKYIYILKKYCSLYLILNLSNAETCSESVLPSKLENEMPLSADVFDLSDKLQVRMIFKFNY